MPTAVRVGMWDGPPNTLRSTNLLRHPAVLPAEPKEPRMTCVTRRFVVFVLIAYVLGGAALGFAAPGLKAAAGSAWGRPGLAVVLVVNIAMPLLVVALSAAYPKLGVALLGTFLATLAFLTAGGPHSLPLGRDWLLAAAQQIRPLLVVACLAYHLLAAATVLLIRPWRRVDTA